MNISLSAKFTLLGSLAVVIVAFAAVENYIDLGKMARQAEKTKVAGQLLGNHLDSDMMHDAMRADVLKAMLGLAQNDMVLVREA